ncbi:33781_t:CDS:2, partial [Racocetra persica]
NVEVATIITDHELALMKTISKEFFNTQYQLCTWYIFKNIRSKFKKLVDIEEFIKIIQKLMYDNNLENDQIDQEIAALWKQFSEAKTYMYKTWISYKNSC